MKKSYIIISLILLLALAACGKNKNEEAPAHDTSADSQAVVPISVELTVPEHAEAGEAVTFEALVKQGDTFVDDADEVVFEVWEEGKKGEGDMVDSKLAGDGLYKGEMSFEHDGLFHVQVHVTARDMHTMPEKEITIGEGGHYEEGHHHDHGAEGFSMHFMVPKNAKTGDTLTFITHVQKDGEPLGKADVRYEVWNAAKEEDAHEYLDAVEMEAGEYRTFKRFEEAGTYQIQVHVKNEEGLHEHQVYELVVE